jgi:nitroreductase
MEKNPVLHALRARGNATAFAAQDVPDVLIGEMLEVGTFAPSGTQLQPYAVVTVRDRQRRYALSKVCGDQAWIAQAPVLLLFCVDLHRIQLWAASKEASYDVHNFATLLASLADTVAFAQASVLGAEALGLAARWDSTVLDHASELSEMQQLPHLVLPVVLVGLGYSRGQPSKAIRLPTASLLHEEVYRPPSLEQVEQTYHELENLFTQWKLVHPEFRKQCQSLGVENMAQYVFADRLSEERIQQALASLQGALERAGFGTTPPPEPEIARRPQVAIPDLSGLRMPDLSGFR